MRYVRKRPIHITSRYLASLTQSSGMEVSSLELVEPVPEVVLRVGAPSSCPDSWNTHHGAVEVLALWEVPRGVVPPLGPPAMAAHNIW